MEYGIRKNSYSPIKLPKPRRPSIPLGFGPDYSPQKATNAWTENKAHSGAILGATITGIKAAAETKNPYAGAAIGGGTLVVECIGCHLGLPLVLNEPKSETPCKK